MSWNSYRSKTAPSIFTWQNIDHPQKSCPVDHPPPGPWIPNAFPPHYCGPIYPQLSHGNLDHIFHGWYAHPLTRSRVIFSPEPKHMTQGYLSPKSVETGSRGDIHRYSRHVGKCGLPKTLGSKYPANIWIKNWVKRSKSCMSHVDRCVKTSWVVGSIFKASIPQKYKMIFHVN